MQTPKYDETLKEIRESGLEKIEREITTPQSPHIKAALPGKTAGDQLNFCANNYLNLASNPKIVEAAHKALDEWGFGMASVRFICGTATPHLKLERLVADYLHRDDAILFSSCFDANGGIFEVMLGKDDAVVSDELNHASLIDGIRLCKAARFRYRNRDMDDLRTQLVAARQQVGESGKILIATDGVFSMDGLYAPLPEICDLAEEFGALVLVDDSHATGFVGPEGRGTPAMFGVEDRVHVLTGTFGKALGGGAGGYVAARQDIIDLARQKARPYLFSNSIPPVIAAGATAAIELARAADDARQHLKELTEYARKRFREAGLEMGGADDLLHPIQAVMFPGEDGARVATKVADYLGERGIYVIAFSYPVVPLGKARIRLQLSAGHTYADVDATVEAFKAALA